MASTNIRSVSVGSILIQSGNGYPTHLSLKGSLYTDLDTAIEYINKDGLNFWATNIDSTNIDLYLSGATNGNITGGTFDNNTDTLFLNNNTGGTITITGFTDYYTTGATLIGSTAYFDRNDSLSAYTLDLSTLDVNDTFVTGGTPDNLTRTYTFTNNTGGTFNVIGLTDVYTTGATTDDLTRTYIFNDNTGGTFTVTGLTDVRITGGTYSGGDATFTNNTGGTFTVTGFTSTDAFVTGFTYSNNYFTIQQNQGLADLSVFVDSFSGLTINGDFVVTGNTYLNNLVSNSISATTHPLYLTANTVQGQLDDTETTFIGVQKTSKTNFKDLYQTGLVRTDADVSVLTVTGDTLTITAVDRVLFVNEILIDIDTNKIEAFLKNYGTIVFTANSVNTPLSANTRGIFYVGIDKTGLQVYRNARIYDQDVCYLARILVENVAGVYTILSSKYFPDIAYNRPIEKGRLVNGTGYIQWSTSPSISFSNRGVTFSKDGINYSNNKLDFNYLVVPDSSGATPMSFLFFLPNITSVATSIAPITILNPKAWYLANGSLGGTDVNDSYYQVYRLFVTVTGTLSIQTIASTNNLPQLGVNAIFANREDALAGLTSVIFPPILPAGDTITLGTFLIRAGTSVSGSQMNDTTDFYFRPVGSTSSSSSVGVTTHDELSGKNDNPTYQHVLATDIVYWNQIVQQTITDGVTGSSPSQNAVYDALALKANDADVVHKSGDTMTGTLTSPAFITQGGNANQFVKGNGSLDSNIYLTAYTDTYVTGGTPNNLTRSYTFTNNTGGTFNVIGLTDVRITGGSFNNSTDTLTFINNTGGTFTITGLTDVFITGGTFNNNNLVLTNNTGGTVTTLINYFSGLTINGNLNVTGNTVTSTISATTYLNLPTDIRVTGGTPDNLTRTYTFTNNTGGTFNVIGLTDVRVTGGTTDNLTRTYTFTNNTGGTFNVIGLTDVRVTGGTYSNGTALFTNNTGGTFSVTGFSTGTSSTDTYVTGGTPNNLTRTYTFTNNTGGTFSVTGLTDVRITGGTHLNGTTTFTNNTGGTFTVSGYSTGTTSFDVFVTGGTFNNSTDTLTFINNTGGTFNVTGLTDNYTTGATFVGSTIYFNRNDALSAYSVTITGTGAAGTGVIRNQFIYTGGPQTFTSSLPIFSLVSVEVQGGGSLYSTQYSSTTTTVTVLDPLNNGDYVVIMYNINDPTGGSFPIDDFIVDGVTTRAPSQNAVYGAIPWTSSTNNIINKSGYTALTFNGGASFTSSVKVGTDTNIATSGMVGSIRYREDSNNSYMDMVMRTDVSVYQWVNIITNTWT